MKATKMAQNKTLSSDMLSGALLLLVTVLALAIHNSPWAPVYESVLQTPLTVKFGDFGLHKPLLLWINDGLMALFFLAVGLEIKNEVVMGELSSLKKATLPLIAAFGGVMCPALIYTALNAGDSIAMRGWAVPVATDIAFALGVLAMLGSRVPRPLKILLLSLAIIDDLAAIVIIALFYSHELSYASMGMAAGAFIMALILNKIGVKRIAPYILIGVVMWICVLKSGIHATLAGVLLSLTIPIKGKEGGRSPVHHLEYLLKPWVAFFIMPVFAFANAGVSLKGLTIDMLTSFIPLGIVLGLFLGKQLGVFSAVYCAVKFGLCTKPQNVSWLHLYGLSLICGIGFTMSLFIGGLAFTDSAVLAQMRLAVLLASLCSGALGYVVLRYASRKLSQEKS